MGARFDGWGFGNGIFIGEWSAIEEGAELFEFVVMRFACDGFRGLLGRCVEREIDGDTLPRSPHALARLLRSFGHEEEKAQEADPLDLHESECEADECRDPANNGDGDARHSQLRFGRSPQCITNPSGDEEDDELTEGDRTDDAVLHVHVLRYFDGFYWHKSHYSTMNLEC